MADTSRNVFDVLEDDIEDSEPAKGAAPADNTESVAATIVSVASSALAAEGESGDAVEAQSWTDVGRTRRLVPKYSLSKEVMGLEAARKSAPPTPSGNVSAVESKKKGWYLWNCLWRYALIICAVCSDSIHQRRNTAVAQAFKVTP